jgi:hypothetical protein
MAGGARKDEESPLKTGGKKRLLDACRQSKKIK